MTGSRALFYIERHRIQDAKLHDAILADGDDVVAQAVSAAVAKRLGLSDAEIAALQRTTQRDDFVAAEHPRASAGSPRGTGGEFVTKSKSREFVSKPMPLHGEIDPVFLSDVKKYYHSTPKKMQELLKGVPVHIHENMNVFRKDAAALGISSDQFDQIPVRISGVFLFPNAVVKTGSINFIQSAMKQDWSEDERHKVVLHEMLHAIDRLHLKTYDSEQFKNAFTKDIQNALTLYKEYDAFGRNIIEYYSHYFSQPSEAFAESGARYLKPPVNESDNEWFNTLFPNSSKAAVKALNGAGIFRGGGESISGLGNPSGMVLGP